MNITRRPPQGLERQGRTRGYSYQRDCALAGTVWNDQLDFPFVSQTKERILFLEYTTTTTTSARSPFFTLTVISDRSVPRPTSTRSTWTTSSMRRSIHSRCSETGIPISAPLAASTRQAPIDAPRLSTYARQKTSCYPRPGPRPSETHWHARRRRH